MVKSDLNVNSFNKLLFTFMIKYYSRYNLLQSFTRESVCCTSNVLMESELDVAATKDDEIVEEDEVAETIYADIGCVNVGFEPTANEALATEHDEHTDTVDSETKNDATHRKKRRSHSHGGLRKHRHDLKRSASMGSKYRSESSSSFIPFSSSIDVPIDELPEYNENQDEGIVFAVPRSQSNVNLQMTLCDEKDVVVDDAHLTSSISSSDTSIVVVDVGNEDDLIINNRSRKKAVVPIGETTDEEENARDTKVMCFLLEVHLFFTKIGLIAHGCAGGVAVAHCIFIFYFLKKNDSQLLENYTDIALVFQVLYYLLLSISTVSVFDRYININADFPESLRHIVEKPIRSVGIVSFCLALIFSVSLSRLDDKIIMSQDQDHETSVTHYEIITWKILNLLRVLTCIVGWVTIALSPSDDVMATSARTMIARRKEKDLHCLIGAEFEET